MNTDHVITMLSKNFEPVKAGQVGRALAWALVVGGAAAFGGMLITLGVRRDITSVVHLGFLAVKLLFTLTLVGLGTTLLERMAHPGQGGRRLFALGLLPFLLVELAGAVALVFKHAMAWSREIPGMNWVVCLFAIPLFAVIPFVALIWAVRKGAPTDLQATGAITGLVAGALGASAYAFHCPDDSIPFIAFWYSAVIVLCALIGTLLGPRLLRW